MQAGDFDLLDPGRIPRAVAAIGMEVFTEGYEHPSHHHREAQLILPVRGLVTCTTREGLWLIPRSCALWIPSGVEHSVRCAGDVEAYFLLIDPDVVPSLAATCSTFSVGPLLRELMIEVSRLPVLYETDGPDGRLVQTMLDQLAKAPVESLHLPMPADSRLRRIADTLLAEPANRMTIAEWARAVAMSERSLCRLIVSQAGMSFGRWRQQFQVMFAIERLSGGAAVQTVAFDLGYESASAFITMFKKVMGQPPGRYLSARQKIGSGDGGDAQRRDRVKGEIMLGASSRKA